MPVSPRMVRHRLWAAQCRLGRGGGLLGVILATAALGVWLFTGPAAAELTFQSSVLEPTATPMELETPVPVATETPEPPTETPSPMPLPPTETPTSTPTETPTETPTLAPLATETPQIELPLAVLPTPRAVTLPTPIATPDRLLLAAQIVDRAVNALTWFWFLCGSLIFFGVAGLALGWGLNRRSQRRADAEQPLPYSRTPLPRRPGARRAEEDGDLDHWPTSLP